MTLRKLNPLELHDLHIERDTVIGDRRELLDVLLSAYEIAQTAEIRHTAVREVIHEIADMRSKFSRIPPALMRDTLDECLEILRNVVTP